MSKEGYVPAPNAPLPTAPPPPYNVSYPQPPFNPDMQATSMPPYQYQPAPLIHDMPVQGGQPPYPGVHYQMQPTVNTTVTENRVVVGAMMVGPQPLRTTCPNCGESIQTRTSTESRGIAHLFCLGLFFIGCCLCSCIPYCLNSLKETRHSCPKCKAHLGTYRS